MAEIILFPGVRILRFGEPPVPQGAVAPPIPFAPQSRKSVRRPAATNQDVRA